MLIPWRIHFFQSSLKDVSDTEKSKNSKSPTWKSPFLPRKRSNMGRETYLLPVVWEREPMAWHSLGPEAGEAGSWLLHF